MNVPKELDAIADVVLAYKPPEKAKAAKSRGTISAFAMGRYMPSSGFS